MKNKIVKYFNIAIGAIIGVFFGYSLYLYQSYIHHPDPYVTQSAPWYTPLVFYGAATVIIVLILIAAKVTILKKQKK